MIDYGNTYKGQQVMPRFEGEPQMIESMTRQKGTFRSKKVWPDGSVTIIYAGGTVIHYQPKQGAKRKK